jgi:hypothetical protein
VQRDLAHDLRPHVERGVGHLKEDRIEAVRNHGSDLVVGRDSMAEPVIDIDRLTKTYQTGLRRRGVHAVKNLTLALIVARRAWRYA